MIGHALNFCLCLFGHYSILDGATYSCPDAARQTKRVRSASPTQWGNNDFWQLLFSAGRAVPSKCPGFIQTTMTRLLIALHKEKLNARMSFPLSYSFHSSNVRSASARCDVQGPFTMCSPPISTHSLYEHIRPRMASMRRHSIRNHGDTLAPFSIFAA